MLGTYAEKICRVSFGTHPQIFSKNAIFFLNIFGTHQFFSQKCKFIHRYFWDPPIFGKIKISLFSPRGHIFPYFSIFFHIFPYFFLEVIFLTQRSYYLNISKVRPIHSHQKLTKLIEISILKRRKSWESNTPFELQHQKHFQYEQVLA